MNIINSYRFAAAGITDPTDITGLDLWLDASDSSTLFDNITGGSTPADDGEVYRWEDKSTNGNHCTQGNTGARPLRRVAEINGLDAIDFDGINDTLSGNSDLTPRQTDAKTVFVVCLPDSVTFSTAGLLQLYNAGVTGQGGLITSEIAYRTNSRTWISSTSNISQTQIVTLSQTGSGNLHTTVSMWLDGSAITRTSGTDGATVDTAGVYIVGGISATSRINGRLCEIIVYNSELSTADRQAVETYLADKWGITL